MVAATAAPETAPEAPAETAEALPGHSAVQRLVLSLFRIVSLETRIVLTRAKLTAFRLALFAGLFVAAAVSGILGLIFLYIGVFRFVAAALGPAWAFVIYGAVHLLLATVLYFIARGSLNRSDEKHPTPEPELPSSS